MVFVLIVLVGIQQKRLKIVSHQYSYENHLCMFHRCLSTIRPYLMTSVMAGIFRKANMIQLPDKFCQLKQSDLLDYHFDSLTGTLQHLYTSILSAKLKYVSGKNMGSNFNTNKN